MNDPVLYHANMVPIADMERMAIAFATSKIFGAKTKEEALCLMLVAQAEGMHPASAARDYDIIQGKGAKKAEAMLRDFLRAGGKVEWHKLDDAHADATFSHHQGGTVRITWDMARVSKAKISNQAMYDKYPRQMLRSRCVSEGVRTVCPLATGGMYTPEDIQSTDPADGAAIEGTVTNGLVEQPQSKTAAPQEPKAAGSSPAGSPADAAATEPKPMTEGQVRVMKAKMVNAAIAESDFEKKFGFALAVGAKIDPNAILAWIANPAGA